jgi:hypothetical protein
MRGALRNLERATGFEPVISTLGKLHVTATPSPPFILDGIYYSPHSRKCQEGKGEYTGISPQVAGNQQLRL